MKSTTICLLASGMLIYASCKKSDLQKTSQLKTEAVSPLGDTNDYTPNLVMSKQGFLDILNDISTNPTAQQLIAKEITIPAKEALNAIPHLVTNVSADSQASNKVSGDGTRIYKTAMQWFLFRNTDSAIVYREKSKSILLVWASINKATDHTPNETAYIGFYEGYSLIRAFIDQDSRDKIDLWFRDRYNFFKKLTPRSNNWETIRGWLMLNSAYVLNDTDLITNSKNAIYTHFDKDSRVDGASADFLGRDAFAYHAYNLLFVGRILRNIDIYSGREEVKNMIYKRVTNWKMDPRGKIVSGAKAIGGTIADQMKFWTPYIIDPANNVHLEFVNTEWAPDKTRADYNKPYNSAGSYYVLDQMAYVMKNQINAIYQIVSPGRTKYNSGLTYYLNSFGFTAEDPENIQVFVYEDYNYLKLGKALSVGNYTMQQLLNLGIMDNSISSIGIPEGLKITLYENDNYGGASISLTRHTPDLSLVNFNDKTSSLKVEKL